MSDFADFEPEDAWDVDDAIANQIGNLLQRLDVLDHVGDSAGRWRSILVEIGQRLRPWIERQATGQLGPREELRVEQLVEDLDFVMDRDDRGR